MVKTGEAQIIKDYIDNLLDDLESGRVAPEMAIVAASQYAGLRNILFKSIGSFAVIDSSGVNIPLDRVTRALREAQASLRAAPPQIQAEKPDAPLSPKDVLERAGALTASGRLVSEISTGQKQKVEDLRKTFIERLVANWIERTRATGEEDRVRASLEAIPADDLIIPNADRVIAAAIGENSTTLQVAHDIIKKASDVKQQLAREVRVNSAVQNIPRELLLRARSPGLERFAAIAASLIVDSGLGVEDAAERADQLSRVAQAINAPRDDDPMGGALPVRFFSASAGGPVSRVVAIAADALFAQLSPFSRQEVIRAAFSRALEGVLVKTDALTARLGKNVVESELFRLVVENSRKELTETFGPGRASAADSGSRQVRGVFEDVLGAVLNGPVVEPLLHNPRETIRAYFELVAISARLPKSAPALLPGRAEAAALLLAAATTGGVAPAGGAVVASVLTAGASAFSKQLPSWERFYLIMASLVSPSVVTGQGILLPTRSPASGGLGGVVAGALSWVGLGLGGAAVKMGSGLLGLLFGGSLISPFGRRTEKTGFWDDMPLVIAVFVAVTLILLFIFPTFLNFGFNRSNTIKSALINAAAEAERRGRDKVGGFDKQYPQPPDYLDPSLFTGKEFACLSFGDGFDTGAGRSRKITSVEASRLSSTLTKFPQLNVLSCGLSCPAKKVNVTVFSELSDYGGFAPPSHPGNIILYQHVFTNYDDQLLAYLVAHELAHNVDWFGHSLSTGFQRLGCGSVPPSTYNFGGDAHESFAESVALYLINHPEIKTYCGGKAYEYLNGALNQCRQ